MELIFVREFAVLAETCNFQLAAGSLSMSQSALSKHIQKLEDELGTELFDRSKKTVTLNENGVIFLNYARQLCKIYDECSNVFAARTVKKDNSLNIGFTRILGQHRLVSQLTEFSMSHPNIQLSLFEQKGDQLKSKLSSGECDFVFTAKPEDFDDEEFERALYMNETMKIILPPGHHLSDRTSVTVKDLRHERMIEHSTTMERAFLKKLCEESGVVINIVAAIPSVTSILEMVNDGMGITMMGDGCSGQADDMGLRVIDLEPRVSFGLYLVYLKKRRSRTIREFTEFFIPKQ